MIVQYCVRTRHCSRDARLQTSPQKLNFTSHKSPYRPNYLQPALQLAVPLKMYPYISDSYIFYFLCMVIDLSRYFGRYERFYSLRFEEVVFRSDFNSHSCKNKSQSVRPLTFIINVLSSVLIHPAQMHASRTFPRLCSLAERNSYNHCVKSQCELLRHVHLLVAVRFSACQTANLVNGQFPSASSPEKRTIGRRLTFSGRPLGTGHDEIDLEVSQFSER